VKSEWSHALLTAAEERELLILAQAGDRPARDRLVQSNLRLVASLAKRYARIRRADLDDLVAAGTLGLFYAIESFDLKKPSRFSTCAVHYVLREIRLAVHAQRLIRLPIYVHKHLAGDCSGLSRRRRATVESARASNFVVRVGECDEVREVVDRRAPDPAAEAELREDLERLQKAMKKLRPRERYVIEHRYGIMR
jgi:RNA polymerase primary sigma factor